MTGTPGFLEFFILEASEYVEQLDGLMLSGGTEGPNAAEVQRIARALRGAATMAKLPSFAELAAGVERIGRALLDGGLHWDPSLGGALVAAIDDLKTLLHSARTWSPDDDRRAATRAAELAHYVPKRQSGIGAGTPWTGTTSLQFLATEAANIAAGLELLSTRGGAPDTAGNVLRRVRALRGVASVKEVGSLAEVLEAIEDAGHGVESGVPLSTDERRVLDTAAAHLRTLSVRLREGQPLDGQSAEREAFDTARETLTQQNDDRNRVVPIQKLFYDDGSGVVESAPNPPTTVANRFRLELVSLGEHLRRVTNEARAARNGVDANNATRDLRRAVRAIQSAAESYGEQQVAELAAHYVKLTDALDFSDLGALDDLARALTDPSIRGELLTSRLSELAAVPAKSTPRGVDPVPATQTPAATLAMLTPVDAPAIRPYTTLDADSASLIDSTIAALDDLSGHAFAKPVPLAEDAVVPIESLLYRGRVALDRAVELRDTIRDGRRAGHGTDEDALDELFDLLELARAE